jgi:hypothetical protein
MKNLILASIVAVSLLALVGCADDSDNVTPEGVHGTGNSVQGGSNG